MHLITTDAEQSVIATMLLQEDKAIRAIETLKVEDFTQGYPKGFFVILKELYEEGKPLTPLMVCDRWEAKRGKGSAIDNIIDYTLTLIDYKAAPAHFETCLIIMKENSLRRDTEAIGKQASFLPVDKLRGKIQGLEDGQPSSIELVKIDKVQTPIDISTLRGLSSGLQKLDKIIGGFKDNDLILLAGRPTMGKSALAGQIATYIANILGRTVVFFTLETSREQLKQRIIGGLGLVNIRALMEGRLNKSEKERVIYISQQVDKLPLYIVDNRTLTVSELRQVLKKMKDKPAMVIVDYLGLMNDPRYKSRDNRVQEVSAISRGLKAIAKEFSVPVIAVSQLSRAPEKRADPKEVPRLSDLRDSGTLEQDADLVMMVHRPAPYMKDPTPEQEGEATLRVIKHRNGPTGKVELRFLKEYTLFVQVEKDLREPGEEE